MKKFVAALALVLFLGMPQAASAGEKWDMLKDTWDIRPWAIILAIPAFIVTSPFMLFRDLMDRESDDEDEE